MSKNDNMYPDPAGRIELQRQVTQTLAEAHNLLIQSTLNGISGADVEKAGKTIERFRAIIQSLADDRISVYENDVANDLVEADDAAE